MDTRRLEDIQDTHDRHERGHPGQVLKLESHSWHDSDIKFLLRVARIARSLWNDYEPELDYDDLGHVLIAKHRMERLKDALEDNDRWVPARPPQFDARKVKDYS